MVVAKKFLATGEIFYDWHNIMEVIMRMENDHGKYYRQIHTECCNENGRYGKNEDVAERCKNNRNYI